MPSETFDLAAFPFQSFDELRGEEPEYGIEMWPNVRHAIGMWRHDIAHLLRGAEVVALPSRNHIQVDWDHEEFALRLGIPPEAPQAFVEKAVHALLTSMSFTQAETFDDVEQMASDQVEAVTAYCSPFSHLPAYVTYRDQVVTIIHATRDAFLSSIIEKIGAAA